MSCKRNCIKIEKGRRLNITAGTDMNIVLTLRKEGAAFPVELSEGVQVHVVSEGGNRIGVAYTVGDAGKIALRMIGYGYGVGIYGVEVTGTLNQSKWRCYASEIIEYTLNVTRGSDSVYSDGDYYEVTMEVGYVKDIIPQRYSELVDDIGLAKQADLLEHTKNEDIHVMLEQKEAWDEHIANEDIHVLLEEKETWNAHVEDTVVHVTQEDKDRWDATAPIEPDEYWY